MMDYSLQVQIQLNEAWHISVIGPISGVNFSKQSNSVLAIWLLTSFNLYPLLGPLALQLKAIQSSMSCLPLHQQKVQTTANVAQFHIQPPKHSKSVTSLCLHKLCLDLLWEPALLFPESLIMWSNRILYTLLVCVVCQTVSQIFLH